MNLFFPSRLSRLSYFVRNVLLTMLGYFILAELDGEQGSALTAATRVGLILLMVVILAYWTWFVVRPRCKDAGINQWCILLAFVPIADILFGLALLFMRPKLSLAGI